VGDRSVQTAQTVPQRRALQAHLGYVDRVQEHCIKDSERAETVTFGCDKPALALNQ